MSTKFTVSVAVAGMCALSLFLLNCGSSSSRPSGILYVLTQATTGIGNNVSSFSIDFNNGNLSLINSNANTCSTSNGCGLPLEISIDPTGATAFVLNQGSPCIPTGTTCSPSGSIAPTIYAYSVNSDGSLGTPMSTATLEAKNTAIAMTRDVSGNFLFVITEGNQNLTPPLAPQILVFSTKPGSTALKLVQSLSLTKVPSGLSVITYTPTGSSTSQELLFVTNNYDLNTGEGDDNTLSVYRVSSSGTLTEQVNSPYVITATDPISVIAVNTTPTGENTGGVFVYVGSQDANGGHLNPFQLCTQVNLTSCSNTAVTNALVVPLATCPELSCLVPPTTAGSNPVQMAADPSNSFLYAISEGSNQVFGFRINTTAGTLTSLTPANQPTGSSPVSLALQPSINNLGQYLYVSNSNSDNITGFNVSTTTGSMGNPITVIAPAAPSGMAVH